MNSKKNILEYQVDSGSPDLPAKFLQLFVNGMYDSSMPKSTGRLENVKNGVSLSYVLQGAALDQVKVVFNYANQRKAVEYVRLDNTGRFFGTVVF